MTLATHSRSATNPTRRYTGIETMSLAWDIIQVTKVEVPAGYEVDTVHLTMKICQEGEASTGGT